ncbi:MAG: hypothetical protein GX654_11510 [Desulfatiglans sp.]|nr:hypothetical protein [Desulfatiglans sp.]
MFKKVLLVCICLLFSAPVFAGDISATYQYSDGQSMTISVRDASHVRMDTTPDSYMLLQGKKIYIVNKDEEGNWSAIDMDQMKGMAGMMGGLFRKKAKATEYDMKLKDTGKKEEVAGLKGNVYSATYYENNKAVNTTEIVFSNKKDIQKINDAWISIAAGMAQIMGQDMSQLFEKSSRLAKENNYGVMIRTGNDIKLKSLSQKSMKDSFFELPAGVEIMEIGAYMGDAQQILDDQEYSESESAISQDVKDVGQAARDEAKNATVDEVKKGVRGLFDKVFNK